MKLIFPNGNPVEVTLLPGVNRLGSAANSLVQLRAPNMPALAAEIHVDALSVHIVPRSGMETIVNNCRVLDRAVLRNGDQLQIAGVDASLVTFAKMPVLLRISDEATSVFGALAQRDYKYALRGLTGAQLGAIFPISTRATVVGRHATCQIRLRSPDVSRHHAVLRESRHGVLVEDLGRNDVYINERRVIEGMLLVGDELRLATQRFLVCELCGPEPCELPALQKAE